MLGDAGLTEQSQHLSDDRGWRNSEPKLSSHRLEEKLQSIRPLRLEAGGAAHAPTPRYRQEVSTGLVENSDPLGYPFHACFAGGGWIPGDTEQLSCDWSPEKSISAPLAVPLRFIPFLYLASLQRHFSCSRRRGKPQLALGSAGKAG